MAQAIPSIWVKNLPYHISEEEFKEPFLRFGPVASVTIARKRVPSRLGSYLIDKGYGFIDFADMDSFQRCSESSEVITIKGRELQYRAAKPRDDRLSMQVFVGGIPAGVTDQDLRTHFSRYQIVDAHIIKQATDIPGFGYVEFQSSENAQSAIRELNGSVLSDSLIQVKPATHPFLSDEEYEARKSRRY